MTACFIIGPEQVVAMHQEAIAYQMMAATGIGQCPTGSATVSYCYDANGSLKERYEGGQLGATYTFDAENRLIAYTPTTGDAATYTYDADGIRNSKTVGTAATWHLTDKNQAYAQVLTETDTATGDLQVRYVHGDDLISQHRPDPTGTRYYHYDGQMSTRALSDAATGASTALTDRYAYDAFGAAIVTEGSTENLYRYTGEQYDSHIAFYYLRARYLDPTIGRLQSIDPLPGQIEDPLSLHRYLYAHANPIMMIDPAGTQVSALNVAITAGIVGILVGILIPVLRGVDQELENASWTERFVHCLWKNGGAIAIGVLSVAFGLMFAGMPIGKTPSEIGALGSPTNVTTHLSRLQVRINEWIRGLRNSGSWISRALPRQVRFLRTAGRIISKVHLVTAAVGGFAAGYTIGLIPGCVIAASIRSGHGH